jgi:DNA-binding Lrp family transcriptional regulator
MSADSYRLLIVVAEKIDLFYLRQKKSSLQKSYIPSNMSLGDMNAQVEIDEVDAKILRELVQDARAKLKDIAKKCSLSSTAIFNRIERLKALKVIKGETLMIDMGQMGFMYPASIGVDVKPHEKEEILRLIRKQTNVIMASESAGINSFRVFLIAKSLKDLEDLKQFIRKQLGSRKVTVSLWGPPQFLFDNVELGPSRR